MGYSVNVCIAHPGANLSDGSRSKTGHMWIELDDGSGKIESFGTGTSVPNSPYSNEINVLRDDNKHYIDVAARERFELTREQYDKVLNYALSVERSKSSDSYNWFTGNTCVAFVWVALAQGGIEQPWLDDSFSPLNLLPSGNIGVLRRTRKEYIEKTNQAKSFAYPRDPFVLDLDGDGIETTNVNTGTLFDHNSDGVKTGTGWIKSDDGLLVRDLNANGTIDSGRELFGDQTLLSNGQTAAKNLWGQACNIGIYVVEARHGTKT